MNNDCELCELEQLTGWHFVNSLLVICDCVTCRIPMLVFRDHGPRTEEEHLEARTKIIELFGARLIKIRTKARRIKDHEHWHIYLEKE